MGWIKATDFARSMGCTPQNIHQRIAEHGEAMAGHIDFEVRGKKKWRILDDFAQDYIRSVMNPKPLSDATLLQELTAVQQDLADVRTAYFKLGTEHVEMAAKLSQVEGERDRLKLENGQFQKLLATSEEAQKAQKEALDAVTKDFETAKALTEKLRKDAAMRAEQAEQAEEENAYLKAELEQTKDALALAARPWYRKILDWLRKIFGR